MAVNHRYRKFCQSSQQVDIYQKNAIKKPKNRSIPNNSQNLSVFMYTNKQD